MDQFGLVAPVNGLGQGVIVAVALTTHSRLYAGFCKTLAVADRDILQAPVAMVDQGVGLMREQCLLQRVDHKVCLHRTADAPADDAPGEDVDHESDVDETIQGRSVLKIADP